MPTKKEESMAREIIEQKIQKFEKQLADMEKQKAEIQVQMEILSNTVEVLGGKSALKRKTKKRNSIPSEKPTSVKLSDFRKRIVLACVELRKTKGSKVKSAEVYDFMVSQGQEMGKSKNAKAVVSAILHQEGSGNNPESPIVRVGPGEFDLKE